MEREAAMRHIIITATLCLLTTAAQAEAVYPTAISEKYAEEKPDKQVQRTCVDQYMTNKATNSNDGLLWQQKGGGGYYAECKRRIGPPKKPTKAAAKAAAKKPAKR
jgi:hypothetical protein